MNNWVDLPVIEVMEYFSGGLATAYGWAEKYAILFGLMGLIWSGLKVMLARMTVKDLWWDTLFKWGGFLLVITLYPTMTAGFATLGNEIGLKFGGGKQTVINNLTLLRKGIQRDLQQEEEWANNIVTELKSEVGNLTLDTSFETSNSYEDYINKIRGEIGTISWLRANEKARDKAKRIIDEYADRGKYQSMFGKRTLNVLDKVLVRKDLKGNRVDWNSDMTNTYVDLDIFLRDADDNETYYISPSALLKVATLSGMVMFEMENVKFNRISDEIENSDLKMLDKIGATLGHKLSYLPQMIMVFFCIIVLLVATVFAEIQYIMTIIEYTIIVGIGAIFIPLMLFDGTKDIPKKLIPVFVSFMIKMIVITTCIMFVYSLIINNCIHTIADDGGMNVAKMAEIFFEAALVYILTQNAPKIAQTILTGQPQLSMGEALQGAGTAAMTAVTMRQAPHAATMAAAKTKSAMNTVGGTIRKNNAAAKAAVASLGENATARQKFKAAAMARGATATQDLKDRMRAKFEAAGKEQGTGFGIVDKAAQMAGLQKPVGAGGGGTDGGSSSYGVTGQFARGADGKTMSYSTRSNPDFRTATKYDPATKSQRSMTNDEFQQEKSEQGKRIGEFIGEQMSRKIEAQKQKKAEQDGQDGALPDSLSGNARAFDR